ncbi:protein ERGIC-53-like [Gigantopelta aegis]|uniref:protein ERGIC-53-like n=1 Tax=Gigantopelta aegis TaxID=1735272 RepID=UPI001B88D7A3|nr:protein ERGIC-53-like [Gigantopelta aegis]
MEGVDTFLVLLSLSLSVFSVLGELPKSRFEYKYSFKGPHLVQKDKSVPFWQYGGDAMAGDEGIRITPSLRSKKGWVWTKNVFESEHWQIDVVVRVQGRGRIGADGMAVWFTETPGTEGPVFGSNDNWKGLGIFLDSFDNDVQHNNPYIMAVVNDGTQSFDHTNDGVTQQLGGCLRDFRNKPFPIRLRVTYYKQALEVYINNGLNQNKDDFELCMRAENIILSKTGYFGVSAATGALADDHDVQAFITHSLLPPGEKGAEMSEEERVKFEKEFEDYYKQLEQAKEEFQKQHPDRKPDPYEIPDDKYFEGQNERELKQIFEGQNMIHNVIRDLNRKLDELLGRQEIVLSKVTSFTQGGQVVQQGGQQQQGQPLMLDTIKRHEVERVLNNQQEVMQQVRDIRHVIDDVQQKATMIHNSGVQGGGGGGAGAGNPLVFHELKDGLKNVRNDISQLLSRPMSGQVQCPPVTGQSCITPVLFIVAVAAQVILTIGYMVYRQNKEAQAKKFY